MVLSRADREQRHEVVGERPIDVVCHDDEIRPLCLHDIGDPTQARRVDLHGGRIARIDHEERLDSGIGQLVDLGVGVLPSSFGVRVHLDFNQLIVIQLGYLDIGREDRHADCDLVARRQQPILAQRIENIRDPGCSAFDREKFDAACGQRGADQFAREIVSDDRFRSSTACGAASDTCRREFRTPTRAETPPSRARAGRERRRPPRSGRRRPRHRHGSRQNRRTAPQFPRSADGRRRLPAYMRRSAPPPASRTDRVGRSRGAESSPENSGLPRPALSISSIRVAGGQTRQLVLEFERAEFGEFAVVDGLHDNRPFR